MDVDSETLRGVITEAPNPIILHAEDGEILLASRSWFHATGFNDEGPLPTIDEWLATACASKCRSAFTDDHHANGVSGRKEIDLRSTTGVPQSWVVSTSQLGSLPDGRTLRITSATDITE